MGEQNVLQDLDHDKRRAFMKAILMDLHALEKMLADDLFETGVVRIGAEQEMFLVDRSMRPLPIATQLLQIVRDPRFTTEIATFNLEANLTPQDFEGKALSAIEEELEELIGVVRKASATFGGDVLLTGILPTLNLSDLTLSNLTDMPRYHELNRMVRQLRGREFHVVIKGVDEIHITHDSIIMEACNTSFQVHLQVSPADFASAYNLAQVMTAPVLAAAVNSPLLFGQRLWAETRLALFQHSVDDRSNTLQARNRVPRVSFGQGWIKDSVLEIFRQDIARFRVLLTHDPDEDPMEVLARGEVPRLTALRLHNGTVWRWNRPCYGLHRGKPHLRVEARILPSGPTIADEVANAAFLFGLMVAGKEEYGPIDQAMEFEDAVGNFFGAARYGLAYQFHWMKGRMYPASELILKELLPLARKGLKDRNIISQDIDRYLGIIQERVKSGRTGTRWILDSLAQMEEGTSREVQGKAIARSMLQNQLLKLPVHEWSLADVGDVDCSTNYRTVGQIMSTDLLTVRPDDVVDYVASIMHWERIRHLPVEDENGRLVGLVAQRDLLPLLVQGSVLNRMQGVPVHAIMKRNLITVTPETPTLEAMGIMREQKIGCLPVLKDDHLVGIVTVYDLLAISVRLFEEELKRSS